MSHFTIAEFWQQQVFAFVETYSFNRGPKSPSAYERITQELAEARQALATGRYLLLTKLTRQVRELEQALCGGEYNVKLTLPVVPDFSTQKIASLVPPAAVTQQLTAIMRGAARQEAYSMCPPVYRDALVFCDARGKAGRVLNICFECLQMITDDGQLVEADFATYDALRMLLTQLGHPIEIKGKTAWCTARAPAHR